MLNTNKKSIIKDSYNLVWFEDFKSKNLDTTKWNIELREPGWVNNELQEYTNKSSNIYIQNNNLIIEAIKDAISKKVRCATILSGGFSESGSEGNDLEKYVFKISNKSYKT